jgi:hypothetical protein
VPHPDVVHVFIQTVGSAFDGDTWRNEVAFILRGIADRLVNEPAYGEGLTQLHDTNGYRVGSIITGNTPGDTYKFINVPKGRKVK